jgi:hypothetical protein
MQPFGAVASGLVTPNLQPLSICLPKGGEPKSAWRREAGVRLGAVWHHRPTRTAPASVVSAVPFSSIAAYLVTFARGQGPVATRFIRLLAHVRGEIERHFRAGHLAGMNDGPRCIPKVTRVERGIVPS